MKTEELLNFFTNQKMWVYRKSSVEENMHLFYSNMKGFSFGRYTIEIKELIRKVEGMRYKVFIYWTPYNPEDLVFKGRFNNKEELRKIIENVNKDLLDVSRANKELVKPQE